MVMTIPQRRTLTRIAGLARGCGRAAALAMACLAAGTLATACVSTPPSAPALVLRPGSGEAFWAIVHGTRGPILAVFTSAACPGCRLLEASLDDLAIDCAGLATVVQADLGRVDGVIAEYNLIKLPTSIVLRDGHVLGRRTGPAPRFIMKSFVEDALRQPSQ